jgi:hypothetical protein
MSSAEYDPSVSRVMFTCWPRWFFLVVDDLSDAVTGHGDAMLGQQRQRLAQQEVEYLPRCLAHR